MAPPPKPPPRLKKDNHNNNNNNRKRGRQKEADAERLRQYGIDLPQIPGLSITIIPLHVFALKTTTQCFRKDYSHTAIPPYHVPPEEESNGNTDHHPSVHTAAVSGSSGNVMDRILDRMQQAAAATTSTTMNGQHSADDTHAQRRERREKQRDSIATWLQAIHRQIKDDNQRKKRKEEEQEQLQADQGINGQQESKTTTSHNGRSQSVVISVLEHLWGIGLNHDRMDVRRAALHMTGHLLEKSADARSWLLQQQDQALQHPVLSTWLDVLTSPTTTTVHEDDAIRRQQRRLWQEESYLLFQHLDRSGYSDFYPCLPVALQRLEQEFSWMMIMHNQGEGGGGNSVITDHYNNVNNSDEHDDNNHNNNMVNWRKWRDLAMEHYNEEAKRVRKLLGQCQVYMDVLVPRVGGAATADINEEEEEEGHDKKQPAAASATTDLLNDDDEDDEDDVAWEDGFDDVEEGTMSNDDAEVSATQHAENVERTLQVMQTAAGLQGGQLEINLQQTTAATTTSTPEQDAQTCTINRSSPEAIEAWNRLEKVISLLSKRHRRRLSLWVNGLMHADGLVQQPGSGGSLVQMSSDKTKRRKQVLDILVELKSAVSSSLSLAKRLGMQPPTSTTTTTTSENSVQSPTATRQSTTTTTSSRFPANIAVRLAAATTRRPHQNLTDTLMRQPTQPNRQQQQQQHRRVQIKYRKK